MNSSSIEAGKTILIVDDDKPRAQMLVGILEAFNHTQILLEEDPLRALDRIDNEGPPGLIITDFRMPPIDGLEFVRRLRRKGLEREWEEVPVILFSGWPFDPNQKVEIANLNVTVYNKPFDMEDFELTVRGAMKRRPLSDRPN